MSETIAADRVELSRQIQRETGPTFHFATRVLPERTRHATYVLYAFFRIADDVVDDPDPAPPAVQRAALERIRREALGRVEPTHPVLAGFAEVRERYGIPDGEVDTFIDAMLADVEPEPFETHDEVDAYLRGSSVAVANMMMAVMGVDDVEAARPHAKALGEAFQLTNFLRDVREDVVEYGRVYLPRSTLERHGVGLEAIHRLEFSEGFAAAVRDELDRAEERYREGVAGIELLPADSRFGVLLAAVLYADHHRLIRAQGYDVLSRRPTSSLGRRLGLLVRTWYHWGRTHDPRATFDAVVDFGGDAPAAGRPADGIRRGLGRPVRAVVSGLQAVLAMGLTR